MKIKELVKEYDERTQHVKLIFDSFRYRNMKEMKQIEEQLLDYFKWVNKEVEIK